VLGERVAIVPGDVVEFVGESRALLVDRLMPNTSDMSGLALRLKEW
jgi:hypothetical protein